VLDQSPINFEIKSPSSSIVVADINRPHNSHKWVLRINSHIYSGFNRKCLLQCECY